MQSVPQSGSGDQNSLIADGWKTDEMDNKRWWRNRNSIPANCCVWDYTSQFTVEINHLRITSTFFVCLQQVIWLIIDEEILVKHSRSEIYYVKWLSASFSCTNWYIVSCFFLFSYVVHLHNFHILFQLRSLISCVVFTKLKMKNATTRVVIEITITVKTKVNFVKREVRVKANVQRPHVLSMR